jgi:hypothetical protein
MPGLFNWSPSKCTFTDNDQASSPCLRIRVMFLSFEIRIEGILVMPPDEILKYTDIDVSKSVNKPL